MSEIIIAIILIFLMFIFPHYFMKSKVKKNMRTANEEEECIICLDILKLNS